MVHAARAGLARPLHQPAPPECLRLHRQPEPDWRGAALAKLTNGLDVAIIQIGSTLPSTTPPTRIAEEYAMIDCLSRRAARRRLSDRAADRRDDLQRWYFFTGPGGCATTTASTGSPSSSIAGSCSIAAAMPFRVRKLVLIDRSDSGATICRSGTG
jgi:hypothetical protein